MEDPDHRNRVGGRDDRAQNDACQDPDRGNGPQREPDDKGADDHADDGEKENRPDLVAQLAHVDIERRLEQQRRQKNIEERLGAEPEIVKPTYDIADNIPRMGREGEVGDTADRNSDQGKQDRVRYRQPLGQREQQADQPQQGGNNKDGLDGIGHNGRPRRTYRQRHLATRRTSLRVFGRVDRRPEFPLTVLSGRTCSEGSRINRIQEPLR